MSMQDTPPNEPPPAPLAVELAALEAMSTAHLRNRYAEVFGEPSRSGNRRWLVRRIAWRLQAIAEGDLSERARTRAELLARDADLRVRPPRGQDSAMDPALRASYHTVSGRVARRDARVPIPGTELTRMYRGEEYRVLVLPHGFEYSGSVYRSLSATAHAITGSHWNGFHFFGLKKETSSPAKETA